MDNRILSRTKETEASYWHYVRSTEVAIRRSLEYADDDLRDNGAPITPMQIVVWLNAQVDANKMAKASLRRAKAAFVFVLGQIGTDEANLAISLIKEIKHSGEKREPKGPAKKTKTISIDDEQKFHNHLISSGSKWGVFSAQWLKFGRMIGFRPCEVEFLELTILENSHYAVKILNAKATNGRSHGEYRTVALSEITEDDLNDLRSFLEQRTERSIAEGGFDRVKEMVRNTIKYQSAKCFPRRSKKISFYTMRHQFSANMKASGLSNREVAALFGHVSIDTAAKHYAKKKSGNVIPGVYALREEVMRVTKGKGNTRSNSKPSASS